jgi:outer membrane usher protein
MNAARTLSQHSSRKAVRAGLIRRRSLCLAVLFGLAHTASAWAAAPADASPGGIDFDSSFFNAGGGDDHVDLSRFDRGAVVLPGVYSVDVTVNDNSWQGQETLTFRVPKGQPDANAVPCFTRDMLVAWGVDLAKVQQDSAQHTGTKTPLTMPAGPVCAPLSTLVPDAKADFDVSALSMQVSIPQLYMNRRHGNWVDPSQWQDGVNAGFADYSFSADTNRSHGFNSADAFLSLNTGINLGRWRLRQLGGASWSNGGSGGSKFHYHSSAAYLQHDLPAWQSQLTVGDYTTSGQVFDAVPFRGVNIASDDRMLPDDELGFAPIVRGVANSNARVTIRQRGQIIYQTTVAPGPFAITDLPTLGGSGNLQVTVTEANGQQETRYVPYSYVTNLLRPGVSRYSVTAGLLNMPGMHGRPPMMEATYQRGLNNLITAYGGITGSAGYGAVLAGAAFNTRFGAVGADLSMSHTQLPGQRTHNGQSLHLTFTKSWAEGTNLSFGAYRYNSSGYYSLTQAESARHPISANWANGYDTFDSSPQRSQFSINVDQSMGRWGSFALNGSDVRYWHGQPSQLTYGASYSNTFFHNELNVQLTLQRMRQLGTTNGMPPLPSIYGTPMLTHRTDTQIMLMVSIPLGHATHAPSLSTNFSRDSQGGATYNASLSGSLGDNGVFSYDANLQHSNSGNGYNLGAQYQGSKATVMARVGHSAGADQASINVNGSAVVFRHGVVLGPPLDGGSFAIVHAPGAAGARVTSATNVRVDGDGYAVVPDLMSYRRNEVDLDPAGLPLNVDLLQTSRFATPRAGSAMLLDFATHAGGRAVVIDTGLLHTLHGKLEPIPFGADVFDDHGNNVGVVGQDSRILARNLPDVGTLKVQWGDNSDQTCLIDYRLPSRANGAQARYTHITASCMADAMLTRQPPKSSLPVAAQVVVPRTHVVSNDSINEHDTRQASTQAISAPRRAD